MRILYFGATWEGSTTVQRYHAMARQAGIDAVQLTSGESIHRKRSFAERVMWKLRYPIDSECENEKLLRDTRRIRPDVVFVESSKVIRTSTLAMLRSVCNPVLAYYTPDDIIASHNLSHTLRRTFTDWDVFFTTKSFNLEELAVRGVRKPVLIGKAYDREIHRPYSPEEVGVEYEHFDCIFIGTYESARARSILALAKSGVSIVVHSGAWMGWKSEAENSNITFRPAVFHDEYSKQMHSARLALCFLRKINRDNVTQRSVEIPAMGRAMIAERTDEHDKYFRDGREYIGFNSDAELISEVKSLLASPKRISEIAAAGKMRCEVSGYDSDSRAREMISHLREACERKVMVSRIN